MGAWQHHRIVGDSDYETPNFPADDFRWKLVATGFWTRLKDAAAKRDAERDLATTPKRAGGSDGSK